MNNIGKKIKITGWVVSGCIFLVGLILAGSSNLPLETLLFFCIGSFSLAWIVGILMAGFGQIVENSDLMAVMMLEKYEKESGEK